MDCGFRSKMCELTLEELLGVVGTGTPHWPMHIVRGTPPSSSLQGTFKLTTLWSTKGRLPCRKYQRCTHTFQLIKSAYPFHSEIRKLLVLGIDGGLLGHVALPQATTLPIQVSCPAKHKHHNNHLWASTKRHHVLKCKMSNLLVRISCCSVKGAIVPSISWV